MRGALVACLGAVALALAGSWSPAFTAAAGDVPRTPGPATPSTTALAPTDATAADVLKAVKFAAGAVVLVNVWATWCDPCRHEFPALLRVQRELAGRGFRLILVSADFPDQRAKVRQFLAEQGVRFLTFLKAESDMAFIAAIDPRWSGALPASFLYGRNGKLSDFWEGETSYAALAGKVEALLAKRPERDAEGGSR